MKFPLTQWSYSHPGGMSTGSRVGLGARQGLRMEAQVLQNPGPWPPNKLCVHGVEMGSTERLGMVGLGGEVLSDPLMTLPSSPLFPPTCPL